MKDNSFLASPGSSSPREAESVRQSARFPIGAKVEVLIELTKEWCPAIVMNWAEKPDFYYEVDGVASDGAFWGLFDSAHVRERVSTVEKSQPDASQNPGEAKP